MNEERINVELHPVVRHPVEIRGQLREMEGDLHHSDLTLSNQDRCAGEMMAHEIGDLYIDHFNESPVEQWSKVMGALRAHGYEISFPANALGQPPDTGGAASNHHQPLK